MKSTFHNTLEVVSDLERVIDCTQEWIGAESEQEWNSLHAPSLEQTIGAQHIRSIRTNKRAGMKRVPYFGIEYKTKDRGIITITKITARENDGTTTVAIYQEQATRETGLVEPQNTKPGIVNTLISQHEVMDHETRVKLSPYILEKASDLACITDPRDLPVLYIAHNAIPQEIAQELAVRLAGLSHVAYEQVPLILPDPYERKEGMLTVFWPNKGVVNGSWDGKRCQTKNFGPKIYDHINELMQYRVIPQDLRFRNIQLLDAVNRIGEQGDVQVLQELLDEQAHTIDRIRDERSTLEATLKETRRQLDVYRRRDEINQALRREENVFSSLAEAVHHAQEEYNQELVFHNQAFDNIYTSAFKHPDLAYKALRWLATTYRDWIEKQKGPYDQLSLSCLQESSFEFRPHQNKITMKDRRTRSDHMILHEGEEIWLPKHLGHSKGHSHEGQLRIGFNELEDKRVIIGYIGAHQKVKEDIQ